MKTKFIPRSLLRAVFVMATVALAGLPAGATTYYVSPNGADKSAGTDWPSAKLTIQAAINAATNNDLILVTNGVYATGGTPVGALTNRVLLNKAVTVQSVNGPLFTTILGAKHGGTGNGDTAVRCAYVGDGAVLSGFTLTNGATRGHIYSAVQSERVGGGVFATDFGSVFNCIITGNSALFAGGACGGTLNSCIISTNVGTGFNDIGGAGFIPGTGGASLATMNNCLVTGNQGVEAGGCDLCYLNNCTVSGNSSINNAVVESVLGNCIVYYNSGNTRQIHTNCEVSYTCATPLPVGTGNITNAPVFVATNNFRLGPFSPCVDAGADSLPGFTDLDGHPRLFRRIDMGCYERQIPGDLNNDGLVNASDLNGLLANYSGAVDQTAVSTVLSNYWPNRLLLAMTNVAGLGGTNVIFALTNSNAGSYSVQCSTNLVDWQPLGTATPRYVFTDTNAPAFPQRYYRLGFP